MHPTLFSVELYDRRFSLSEGRIDPGRSELSSNDISRIADESGDQLAARRGDSRT
jgi:hypothetical protein